MEFPNKDYEESFYAKTARLAFGHDGSLAPGATEKDAKPIPAAVVPAKHVGPPTALGFIARCR